MSDPVPAGASGLGAPSRAARRALESALELLRLQGAVYCLFEGRHDWGLRLPAAPVARFHAVRSGACWMRVEDGPVTRVEAEELVLLPGGERHDVLADEASDVIEATAAFGAADPFQKVFTLGDGDVAATLVCGGFAFPPGPPHPLREALPREVRLGGDAVRERLGALLDLAEGELRAGQLAAGVVLGRLSEILFIEALRLHAESLPPGSRGWLAALRDPAVAAALAAIHEEPARDWRVEGLARLAGTSKTVLTERFGSLLDLSPARYVARWRMVVARDLLRGPLGLAEIADRVGYASESSFSRAFQRQVGCSPSDYREQSRRGDS